MSLSVLTSLSCFVTLHIFFLFHVFSFYFLFFVQNLSSTAHKFVENLRSQCGVDSMRPKDRASVMALIEALHPLVTKSTHSTAFIYSIPDKRFDMLHLM